MIKRVIEISQAKTFLSIKLGQLIISRDREQVASIPCEDIGVLLVDHSGVTYTHSVFTSLLAHGAAVVLCDGTHHPAGMLLPLETNTVQSERFRLQTDAGEAVKKRLWQQVIKAKIAHQAHLLGDNEKAVHALNGMRKRVRSGDPDNVESQAAKRFWGAFLQGIEFRRNRDGGHPNHLLNYGYMVMRAAVARAICSAGLLPTFGIHHRNRYNAYCLADDMIEPFRGFVERRVREICNSSDGEVELDQHVKASLLGILYEPVVISGLKGPLMVGLHRTMASLVRCLSGEQKELDLPEL
ncbi:MAG: type II CRISPR-associated endonuclease Cas1 [Phycisphaerae bacterium]|nr:type II CRISPR-associated endonuclease Cas1 [Phycisphaerae bacterium]